MVRNNVLHNVTILAVGTMSLALLMPTSVFAESAVAVPLFSALQVLAQKNPQAASHRATARAMQARSSAVDSLPDPMIGIGLSNLPARNPTPSGSTMSGIGIEVKQVLPSLGTLAARGEAVLNNAAASNWQAVNAREEALAKGVTLYLQALAVASQLDALGKTRLLLQTLLSSATSRYRTGAGMLYDLDQVEVELAMISSLIDATGGQLQALKSGWLPLSGELFPEPLTWEGFSDWQFALADLLAKVATAPLVQAAEAQVRAAEERERAARWSAFPDLTLSGGVMRRPGAGDTDLNVGMSMSVPLAYPWRQGREVDAAQEDRSAMAIARQLAAYEVEAQIRNRFALYTAALAEENLYRERILPADSNALASASAAYEAGRADIMIPIKAISNLYRDQAELQQRRSNRISSAAQCLASSGILGSELGITGRNSTEENK